MTDGPTRLANWHDDLDLPWDDTNNPTRVADKEMSLLGRCGPEPSPPARRRK